MAVVLLWNREKYIQAYGGHFYPHFVDTTCHQSVLCLQPSSRWRVFTAAFHASVWGMFSPAQHATVGRAECQTERFHPGVSASSDISGGKALFAEPRPYTEAAVV